MHELFREIWDEREDEMGIVHCFETGRELEGSRFRSDSCCYHHILKQGKYPQYKFLKRNIVIIDPEIHYWADNNIKKVPKIQKLTEELLSLHYEHKLEET